MNQQTMVGTFIDPVALNRWRMTGPRGVVKITLSDSGGWDVTSMELVRRDKEHFPLLHQALLRGYNLTQGIETGIRS